MDNKEIDRLWLNTLKKCNEVQRRRLAGVKAIEIGWGGVSYVCKLANMSPNTVKKGISEIKFSKFEKSDRLRKIGGGRKKIMNRNIKLKKDFEKIIKNNTAGNPMKNVKWTHKSTYSIAKSLKSKGYDINSQRA